MTNAEKIQAAADKMAAITGEEIRMTIREEDDVLKVVAWVHIDEDNQPAAVYYGMLVVLSEEIEGRLKFLGGSVKNDGWHQLHFSYPA